MPFSDEAYRDEEDKLRELEELRRENAALRSLCEEDERRLQERIDEEGLGRC